MKNDTGIISFTEAKLSPEAIVAGMGGANIPTPQEVKAARLALGLGRGEFGKLIGAYRIGWEHGLHMRDVAYKPQTIADYERGRKQIGEPFAYAFREWQRALAAQLPEGVRFITQAIALQDIPPNAIIVPLKSMVCEHCGQLIFAPRKRKYCPPPYPCRKQARKARRIKP